MNFITDNGMRGVSAIWYTNIAHGIIPPELPFTKRVEMPAYDNADAVNVNKSSHLPPDYTGIVGVPISFLQWYNPEKFEILGLAKDFTYDGKPCYIMVMFYILAYLSDADLKTIYCHRNKNTVLSKYETLDSLLVLIASDKWLCL